MLATAAPTAPICQTAPSEHPDAVTQFLTHWRPDVCLWAWGALRPNLVMETKAMGCPMILFDADVSGFDSMRDRWLPEMSRQLMRSFSHIILRAPAAGHKLEALGIPTTKMQLAAPLRAGGYALPCPDEELSGFREQLARRPVWLAVGVQANEIRTVIEAHLQALKLSHRLLLVVLPANDAATRSLRARVEKEALRITDWTAGEDPEESTKVLLTEEDVDLGLFYRLAPVSFLGSSMEPGFDGRNPFEAAALGSAVLYGPNVRRYLPYYTRLANAGAARIVKDAETLGTAVSRLIAPDQAAGMACAGWDVISEGAATMDLIVDCVEAALDGEEPEHDARA